MSDPYARLRLTLFGRILTLTAAPWSAVISRATPTIATVAPSVDLDRGHILREISAEVERANAKHGSAPAVCSNRPRLAAWRRDPADGANYYGVLRAATTQREVDHAKETGELDGLLILVEEVAEAIEAAQHAVRYPSIPNTAKVRAELVQVCAVGVKLIERLDERGMS